MDWRRRRRSLRERRHSGDPPAQQCFGKRPFGLNRRVNECHILEPSEMIVIDYPPELGSVTLDPDEITSLRHRLHSDSDSDQFGMMTYNKGVRSSRSSDTSSAYSGSVHSSLEVEPEEVDLTGLVESAVDSDEDEDLVESMESLVVRDAVRDCLERDPSERTEDDIEVLLEFTQHLRAFSNMTLAVRRALCSVMVFAVVEKAGTVVMHDKEELDSWSVIVNGQVEVEFADSTVEELHMGDSFGITPTTEKMYHKGTMRTRVPDCQFVCITQGNYCRILHQGEENTKRHEQDGEVVLVTEHRSLSHLNRKGHIVIKGTPERLMGQLVEENSLMDPTYVEDFLLTHRAFISSSTTVADFLLHWFSNSTVRDRVTRVVLFWVNNHFTDFETEPQMMEFLEIFENLLEKEKMAGQLRLLNIACAAKARPRTVTLARANRDDVLHFSILGGYERGFGIFISKVEKGSKAEDVGLKRGDQILEVNGQSFQHVNHAKALETLRSSTHLSITVKSNLLGFKEMLATPENSPRPKVRKDKEIARLQPDPKARLSTLNLMNSANVAVASAGLLDHSSPNKDTKSDGGNKGFMTLGHNKKGIRKALTKITNIQKNIMSYVGESDDSYLPQSGSNLYHSHSNPDLSQSYLDYLQPEKDFPEHVLKVYKSDQSCKYLLTHKETTAREVVMLALREFGITDPSSSFGLCQVTVAEGGIIKQRRLPDQLQNLAERIDISSRYYLKNNTSTEALVPDELAGELARESQVSLLQLHPVEVAAQLTLEDFAIFRQIEPTEYIDDLFELKSRYGTPQLGKFEELVNREMFWVVSEVCSEHSLVRRSKLLKQLIKIARHCRECKNFNSMFNILSGLQYGAVNRLKQTWEKLPGKYKKLFRDMEELMNPSRNMSKYRNLVNSENVQPPIIPYWPIVKKDLTFIHLGNDTKVEGLVNFEKLRMIAKEVRALSNMCSAPYDLFTMLELGGGSRTTPSAAMLTMNQMTLQPTQANHTLTYRKRKKSQMHNVPNPKKMFEEAQMVRRVKAYLSNLKVINDEDQLRVMSHECEPPPGQGSGTVVRRRQPSPTLSTASSNSSASEGRRLSPGPGPPKFGTASPQSVRKLLSLSDPSKTRPYHPPKGPSGALPLAAGAAGVGVAVLGTQPPSPRPHSHERSHSDAGPVDLSAESSSVTSLNNLPLRKSHTSGSVGSSSSFSTYGYEIDSAQIISYSPPAPHRRYTQPASLHSPPLPRSRNLVPAMPPILKPGLLPPPPPPQRVARYPAPPDYHVAARHARYHYNHHDEEDEETQVSAV